MQNSASPSATFIRKGSKNIWTGPYSGGSGDRKVSKSIFKKIPTPITANQPQTSTTISGVVGFSDQNMDQSICFIFNPSLRTLILATLLYKPSLVIIEIELMLFVLNFIKDVR